MTKARARAEKEFCLQRAADEAEEYSTYLELLLSLHTECGPTWDWRTISTTPPPAEPVRPTHREQAARAQLDAYEPGFFERLFGGAKAKRAELENQVSLASVADENEHRAALSDFQRDYAYWNTSVRLAPRVMRFELAGCRDALAHAEAFDELATFRLKAKMESLVDGIATIDCVAEDPDVVPNEEVKLSASGKISKKEMAASKYWGLYQDHICSAAIRAAREVLAALPVERVIVNVRSVRLNTSTGHLEPQTILGVHFLRGTLFSLRLDSVDPSDAMRNFPHKMKFKKTVGFDTVEPVTPDENWVST